MNKVKATSAQSLRRGLNLFEVLYMVVVVATAIAVSKWLANAWQISPWVTLPLVLTAIALVIYILIYILNRIGDVTARNSKLPRMLVGRVCDDGSPIGTLGVNLIAEIVDKIDRLEDAVDTYASLVDAFHQLEVHYRHLFAENRCERYLDRVLAAKRCEAALRWDQPVDEVENLYNAVCSVGFYGGEPHKRDIDEARSRYLRAREHLGLR